MATSFLDGNILPESQVDAPYMNPILRLLAGVMGSLSAVHFYGAVTLVHKNYLTIGKKRKKT